MNELSGDNVNPYAPAPQNYEGVKGELDSWDADAGVTIASPSLSRLILRWTLVCGIAAGPSFFIGYDVSRQQVTAMTLGVLMFIALYVMVDLHTRHWRWRQKLTVRRIMIFCYATRIAISICFPIGMMVDLLAGLVSVTIVGEGVMMDRHTENVVSEPMSFATTLVLTLVQGFVLNLGLAIWGLLSFAVVWTIKFIGSFLPWFNSR
jgi:hypothetical protein